MDWTQDIDAIGLLCPLPVLRANGWQDGSTIIRVSTTDPAALVDMPHFCAEAGHSYLGNEEDGDVTYRLSG